MPCRRAEKPPTIVGLYRHGAGWAQPQHEEPLTLDAARRLHGEGYTIVRTRRGWRRPSEFSLLLYIRRSEIGPAFSTPDAQQIDDVI